MYCTSPCAGARVPFPGLDVGSPRKGFRGPVIVVPRVASMRTMSGERILEAVGDLKRSGGSPQRLIRSK
jgi:hypothetical protein